MVQFEAILQVAQLHIIVPVPKPRLSNAELRHREGIPSPNHWSLDGASRLGQYTVFFPLYK